jgi:5-methylcytosine-specific restriction endonuclease McrA
MEFGKDNRNRSGLKSWCKKCESDHKVKKYNADERERIRISKYKSSYYDRKAADKEWTEKEKARKLNYQRNNKDKVAVYWSIRRANKLRATPPWINSAHKEEMKFLAWFARSIKGLHGLDYHVDHIHPLKGKNFCGLHVPWNMQVLSQPANDAKGNKLVEEDHVVVSTNKRGFINV